MIALGIMGLRKGDFTVVWQPVPKGAPAREVLAYSTALISLTTGLGLLFRRTAAFAARLLLGVFILWLLLWRVRPFFIVSFVESTWSCGQTLVMTSAAWILFSWFATDWDRQHLGFITEKRGIRVARVLYAIGLIPFGLAHFMYVKETVVLIPGWLPFHVAWAYFTGATFIAASVAILTGVYARLATALSALQIGLFALVVWIPIVLRGGINEYQWGEFVITLALTAAAWVVADSYRGIAWLATRPMGLK
jgi:uncharacterized membrane protein